MEDWRKEKERELAKIEQEHDAYLKQYPLAQYSTTQLKAELRRRKGGNNGRGNK